MASGAIVVLSVSRLGRQIAVLGIGLGVELAAYLSITYLVDRPRPSVEATAAFPSTPSFPSGHVAAAVVLYGGLAIVVWSLDASRAVRGAAVVVAFVLPTLVAWSRVYEGLHYPTDVVAGVLLGASCLVVAVNAADLVPVVSTSDDTAPGSVPEVTSPAST
jgi:membrane-associated phospholipid phosphatase